MKKISLYLLGLLFIVACSKNHVLPENGVEAKLVVIDNEGKRTNTITQGEDFSLSLEFINNTSDNVYYHYKDYVRIFSDLVTHNDFLLVYQLNPDTGKLKSVGRPYDEGFKPVFLDFNPPPLEKASGESIMLIGMQWNEDSIPLHTGNYYSALKYTTTLEGIPGKVTIDTDITFKVQ